jgi:hypothetical protein
MQAKLIPPTSGKSFPLTAGFVLENLNDVRRLYVALGTGAISNCISPDEADVFAEFELRHALATAFPAVAGSTEDDLN